MKYVVMVYEESDDGETNATPEYRQAVDATDFNLSALIRAVNTRKRVRAPRGKKGGDA